MTTTIPAIPDKARRILRTVVQVVLAISSFAPLYPGLVTAFGAPTGSRVALWLGLIGTWLAIVAAVAAWVMSIPGVDRVLTVLGVGSISPRSVQIVLRDAAAQIEPVLEQAGPVLAVLAPETAAPIEKLEDIVDALADPTPVQLEQRAPAATPERSMADEIRAALQAGPSTPAAPAGPTS